MTKYIKNKKTAIGFFACLLVVFFFAVSAYAGNVYSETKKVSVHKPSPILVAKKTIEEEKVTMPRYQETLKKAMDKLFSVLESIEKEPGITLEEKKKKAIRFIRNVRWGPDKKDYFWINDLQGKMIVDPYIPSLEGKDLIKFEDHKGKKIFLEYTRTCSKNGQGFIDHLWPKYEGKRPVPKVSFVRLFKPWGWIVGTGIYKDTIEAYELPEQVEFYVPFGAEPPLPEQAASPV